jgi:hypothetical protein
VEGLVILVTVAILLTGLIPFRLTDADISVDGTGIPDNRVTASQTKARNSSAIAMIMIALITLSGEGGSNGL